MSTAMNELAATCRRENDNVRDGNHEKVIRYSERYAKAYDTAKRIVADAEAFTQGDEYKRLAMADAISQQHRSHQQGFVRGVIIPVLATLELNAKTNNIDARNQGAADFAIAALTAADEKNATWMPFI